MSIIELLGALVVLGLLAWAVQSLVPMTEPFKKGFYVACVILVVLVFMAFFGIGPTVHLWPAGWKR